MAFGFGFNKAKVLAAAERHVQQGKLLNAIAEYEKVVKADPKDLTVLNTIGDLYARIGQTDQAASYFRSVGDAYAQQGFTVKAIAMYKKLTKLNPTNECVLKLAELYSQQGLFNDARAQYLQLAEQAMRSGHLDHAVQIFQKILEMDPENTAMQVKLADVYVRLGKKDEGAKILTKAAEALQARGAPDQAEEILKRLQTLDPNNSAALLLRGKAALESGDGEGAIELLRQVPNLEANPDGLRYLMRASLLANRRSDAASAAGKLFTLHKDSQGIAEYADAMLKAGAYDEALRTYYEYSEQLLAGDTKPVIESLRAAIGHVKDNPAALEVLRDLLTKAGDTANIGEITELLAHAYVQNGQLAAARDLYKQLVEIEPDNPLHAQNYQQIAAKLGGGEPQPATRAFNIEDGALQLDELEATAPVISEHYADELATVVRAAITDAELFLSYNLPSKAMAPLLAILPKAPKDVRVNQRLASLHARNARFADAAQCCRTLAQVFSDAGYPDHALKYAELAEKYGERAKSLPAPAPLAVPAPAAPKPKAKVAAAAAAPASTPTQEVAAPAERSFAAAAPWPIAPVTPPPVAPQAKTQPAEEEIDLSGEWNAVAEKHAPAAAEPPASTGDEQLDAILEEIRFYLDNSMWEEAWAAISNGEALSPGAPELEKLKKQFEASRPAKAPVAPPEPEPEVAAAPAEPAPAPVAAAPVAFETSVLEEPPAQEAPVVPEEPAAQEAPPAEPEGDGLKELVFELEQSLGDLEPQPQAAAAKAPAFTPPPAPAPVPAPVAAVPVAPAKPVVAPPAPQVAPPTAAPVAAKVATPVASVPAAPPAAGDPQAQSALADIFSDFKQEIEHDSSPAEDPDTHYNLGVAFKEMGLLDEAISELQKVCQSVESGHPFNQAMQAYTWLAQCFLEKGVPEAAVRWYEKALTLPAIDAEARTALHYELASAYETANNKESALAHFLEVYGSNIDYRDVSERIKALKS